jgi:hypothetical protein
MDDSHLNYITKLRGGKLIIDQSASINDIDNVESSHSMIVKILKKIVCRHDCLVEHDQPYAIDSNGISCNYNGNLILIFYAWKWK